MKHIRKWRCLQAFIIAALAAAGPGASTDSSGSGAVADLNKISVDVAAQGVPISRSFLGLSFEGWDLWRYAGKTQQSSNPFLLRLLAQLNLDGANPPAIRIGGGSADRSMWNPGGLARPAGISYEYTQSWINTLRALLARTGSRVIITLNMAQGDPNLAVTWAAHLQRTLPAGRLYAFEVGNEPDNYPQQSLPPGSGSRRYVRPASYDFDDYLQDLRRYSNALRGVSSTTPLAAPAFASFKWYYPSRLRELRAAGGQSVGILSWHRYPVVSCGLKPGDTDYPTIEKLLAPRAEAYLVTRFSTLVKHARSEGQELRITELNSVGCGGAVGVSDTMAATLWSIRTLFDLAQLGVTGVNVHGMHDRSYSPIIVDANGNFRGVGPIYYGMLMFAHATQGDAVLLPVTGTKSSNLYAYATRARRGTLSIVLLNFGSTQTTAKVNLRRSDPARSLLLTAPAIGATRGISIAGQTYDNSKDGNAIGRRRLGSVSSKDHKHTVHVPANSAVLLSVP